MSEDVCRIDRMSFANMEKIHELTDLILRAGPVTAWGHLQAGIDGVVDKINAMFKFKLSLHTQYQITLVLRKVALLAKQHAVFDLYEYSGKIIELVQGDVNMDNNELSAMVRKNVKDAVEEAVYQGGATKSLTAITEEYTAKIVSDVFGNKPPVNPTYVDKYYEMDPETEDVLVSGNLLLDGMKVLIEDPSLRANPDSLTTPQWIDEARVMNRWCTVSYLKTDDGYVTFVGTYEDGIKRKRTHSIKAAWIVKKDSIPRIDTLINPEGHVVVFYTTEAMKDHLGEIVKRSPKFSGENYRVQTGIGGDIIPLKEYLLSVGLIGEGEDTYEVVAAQGVGVSYIGTPDEVVKWASSLKDPTKFGVNRVGDEKRTWNLATFVEEFGE